MTVGVGGGGYDAMGINQKEDPSPTVQIVHHRRVEFFFQTLRGENCGNG